MEEEILPIESFRSSFLEHFQAQSSTLTTSVVQDILSRYVDVCVKHHDDKPQPQQQPFLPTEFQDLCDEGLMISLKDLSKLEPEAVTGHKVKTESFLAKCVKLVQPHVDTTLRNLSQCCEPTAGGTGFWQYLADLGVFVFYTPHEKAVTRYVTTMRAILHTGGTNEALRGPLLIQMRNLGVCVLVMGRIPIKLNRHDTCVANPQGLLGHYVNTALSPYCLPGFRTVRKVYGTDGRVYILDALEAFPTFEHNDVPTSMFWFTPKFLTAFEGSPQDLYTDLVGATMEACIQTLNDRPNINEENIPRLLHQHGVNVGLLHSIFTHEKANAKVKQAVITEIIARCLKHVCLEECTKALRKAEGSSSVVDVHKLYTKIFVSVVYHSATDPSWWVVLREMVRRKFVFEAHSSSNSQNVVSEVLSISQTSVSTTPVLRKLAECLHFRFTEDHREDMGFRLTFLDDTVSGVKQWTKPSPSEICVSLCTGRMLQLGKKCKSSLQNAKRFDPRRVPYLTQHYINVLAARRDELTDAKRATLGGLLSSFTELQTSASSTSRYLYGWYSPGCMLDLLWSQQCNDAIELANILDTKWSQNQPARDDAALRCPYLTMFYYALRCHEGHDACTAAAASFYGTARFISLELANSKDETVDLLRVWRGFMARRRLLQLKHVKILQRMGRGLITRRKLGIHKFCRELLIRSFSAFCIRHSLGKQKLIFDRARKLLYAVSMGLQTRRMVYQSKRWLSICSFLQQVGRGYQQRRALGIQRYSSLCLVQACFQGYRIRHCLAVVRKERITNSRRLFHAVVAGFMDRRICAKRQYASKRQLHAFLLGYRARKNMWMKLKQSTQCVQTLQRVCQGYLRGRQPLGEHYAECQKMKALLRRVTKGFRLRLKLGTFRNRRVHAALEIQRITRGWNRSRKALSVKFVWKCMARRLFRIMKGYRLRVRLALWYQKKLQTAIFMQRIGRGTIARSRLHEKKFKQDQSSLEYLRDAFQGYVVRALLGFRWHCQNLALSLLQSVGRGYVSRMQTAVTKYKAQTSLERLIVRLHIGYKGRAFAYHKKKIFTRAAWMCQRVGKGYVMRKVVSSLRNARHRAATSTLKRTLKGYSERKDVALLLHRMHKLRKVLNGYAERRRLGFHRVHRQLTLNTLFRCMVNGYHTRLHMFRLATHLRSCGRQLQRVGRGCASRRWLLRHKVTLSLVLHNMMSSLRVGCDERHRLWNHKSHVITLVQQVGRGYLTREAIECQIHRIMLATSPLRKLMVHHKLKERDVRALLDQPQHASLLCRVGRSYICRKHIVHNELYGPILQLCASVYRWKIMFLYAEYSSRLAMQLLFNHMITCVQEMTHFREELHLIKQQERSAWYEIEHNVCAAKLFSHLFLHHREWYESLLWREVRMFNAIVWRCSFFAIQLQFAEHHARVVLSRTEDIARQRVGCECVEEVESLDRIEIEMFEHRNARRVVQPYHARLTQYVGILSKARAFLLQDALQGYETINEEEKTSRLELTRAVWCLNRRGPMRPAPLSPPTAKSRKLTSLSDRLRSETSKSQQQPPQQQHSGVAFKLPISVWMSQLQSQRSQPPPCALLYVLGGTITTSADQVQNFSALRQRRDLYRCKVAELFTKESERNARKVLLESEVNERAGIMDNEDVLKKQIAERLAQEVEEESEHFVDDDNKESDEYEDEYDDSASNTTASNTDVRPNNNDNNTDNDDMENVWGIIDSGMLEGDNYGNDGSGVGGPQSPLDIYENDPFGENSELYEDESFGELVSKRKMYAEMMTGFTFGAQTSELESEGLWPPPDHKRGSQMWKSNTRQSMMMSTVE